MRNKTIIITNLGLSLGTLISYFIIHKEMCILIGAIYLFFGLFLIILED